MALPALQKTWQGGSTLGGVDFVNYMVANPASTSAAVKEALLQIKDAMIGMNTNAWTVTGSSNASAASMDGTDRWATTADLVENPGAGAYSWIVLRQTAIATNFEVCFAMAGTNAQDLQIVVSPSAGFTGGSTTARPTATDEHEINGANSAWFGDLSTAEDLLVSVIMSTDGEVTRIFGHQYTAGDAQLMMGFEVPKDPPTEWTDPSIYYHHTETFVSSISAADRDDWDSTTGQVINATILDKDGADAQVVLTAAGPFASTNSVIDTFDETNGIRFYAPTLTYEGLDMQQQLWGTMYDWYWPSLGASNGAVFQDSFPAAGDRTFVCVGQIVVGWLDDSATDFQLNGPEFVEVSSGTLNSGAGTSITITKPASVQEGDLLMFVYLGDGVGSNITGRPTGFGNQISGSQSLDGTTSYQVLDQKLATASEPTNYTWTRSVDTNQCLYALFVIRPVSPSLRDPGTYTGAAQTATATPNAPSTTTSYPQTNLFNVWMANRLAGTGALGITTPPTGGTARLNLTGAAISRPDLRIDVYEEPRQNPGSVPVRTLTYDDTQDGYTINAGVRAYGAI